MTISEQLDRVNEVFPLGQSLIVLKALSMAAEEIQLRLAISSSGEYSITNFENASGDFQSVQDIESHQVFLRFLSAVDALGSLVSEEGDQPIAIGDGQFGIAIDPFDGSRAFRYGIPPGSIFGVFRRGSEISDFSGKNLICSGFFLYGKKVDLYFACNGRVYSVNHVSFERVFSLGSDDRFVSCNTSNYYFWPEGWRNFVSTKIFSSQGGTHFNTRWFGSLVTHVKTVLISGGCFLYPADKRAGYTNGHLRLIYEAIPIANLIEACGGAATNGECRILEITPRTAHEKTPFAFGEKVLIRELEEELRRYPQL